MDDKQFSECKCWAEQKAVTCAVAWSCHSQDSPDEVADIVAWTTSPGDRWTLQLRHWGN